MKRILKQIAAFVLAIAVIVCLDTEASYIQIGVSFAVAAFIACVFMYQWDKKDNQKKSP
ncbi:hypothetical protein [Bacteroides sp.]|uniref:hypothetical protein n=1 Tax=Bacteroides sp. TaxID=29523 RepID=UPI00261578FA|nr:hypothetical protein [Bacteroides sp.]